jgi:transcriptional regulator of acetoin/glycerol metabolism
MEPLESKAAGRGDGGRIDALLEQLYRCALEVEGRSALELREWVDRAEAWRIVAVLRECRGNRSAAARRLGIGRRTLYTKMERLGVGAAWGLMQRKESRAPEATAIALAAATPGDLEGSA